MKNVTVNMSGGKALIKLRLICEQIGWDFDKTLDRIINKFIDENEMKIAILSQIPKYKRNRV